jgi:iron(III) transport system permease protein
MNSFINSAVLATGALAIALPVGAFLAVLITRFVVPGRRLAIVCLGLLLFLPLYVQLSAWDAALGKLGWLTLSHDSGAEPFLSGMRAAIFVHGMAAIPWVALIIGIGLLQVDPAQEEAASLVAPLGTVLWRITLPQTLPFIVAAALWTVIGTMAEMTVTNIYLINPSEWTLTERFYMSWSLNLSPISRFDFVLALVGLSLVGTIGLWVISRSIRNVMESARPLKARLPASGYWFAWIGLWSVLSLMLAVPIGNLVVKAGFVVIHDGNERVASWSAVKGVAEVAAAPIRYGREIRGTVLTAVCAATLAVSVAAALAWAARRGGRGAIPAFAATFITFAAPGPLVGIGLIALFNHDIPPRLLAGESEVKSWLLILYDNTPVVPIMAQAIRALPLTILVLWHSFATLNRDMLAAAALEGCSPWHVFWKIVVPQRWRAITAAWIMAFAIAAGDLAWCHLVTPPGLDLLSRRIFGLVHSGVEEQVAAISLIIVMSYAALAFVVLWIVNGQESASDRCLRR